jgi:HEAT repeat protein
VLLDYANDELNCDEAVLDALRPHIQTYWQTEQRLVVRTKVRFLEALSKIAADSPLSGEQIKEALRRFEDFLKILDDNRPNRGGSETWHFTIKLWHKRSDRAANLQRFGTEWEQRRPHKSKQVTEEKQELVETGNIASGAEADFWWQLCKESLEAQHYQRLTINPLTVADGVTFDLHELYVPLALVERRQQDRRDADISAHKGSQLYEPEELETAEAIALEEFLASLLSTTVRQRIAIVGEPGAGKTTLLQKIAASLLERHALPIWISLADLQGATLENYLLQDWLKQATRKVNVSPEMQEALTEQFRQGQVWLLLDAVDEMAIDGSMALATIARQLRGWVADAHVVLTCRLNVWDGGKNALDSFTTYRNLSFSYGDVVTAVDQIGQFIERWFHNNPALGHRLRLELDKPERKTIKDAVKNPLRLALLCRSWSFTQGTLPSTKATLYQQFIETIYEWKQDCFPTTPAQRQQLNQALGQLALRALAQSETRFRLPHSFMQQAFKEALDLMPLALQLGWLNQVGVSASLGEKVYAFYHPTFQEYFAAKAISDWQFFFNSSYNFPVFNLYWREVILLWLGRTDISTADKEAFIKASIELEDGCGGFYSTQACFLAAAGLAEFPQCSMGSTILKQLVEWRFDKGYPVPLCEGARVALLQTDRTLAISALEQFVLSNRDLFSCWNAAYSLGKTFDPGNSIAIAALTKLINTIHNETLRLQISESLAKVDPGNAIAVRTLIEILNSTPEDTIRRKAAYSLGKISPGNPKAISTLEDLINFRDDNTLRSQAAENLLMIAPNNQVALSILKTTKKGTARTSRKHQTKLARTQNLDKTISTLEQRLAMAEDAANKRRIAYRLGILQPGHLQAIACLLELLLSPQSPVLYKRIVENLKEVLLEEQLAEVVLQLKQRHLVVGQNMRDNSQAHECYKLLWDCAQRMSYSRYSQIWSND